MSSRKRKKPVRKEWQPLRGGDPSPDYLERLIVWAKEFGIDEATVRTQLPDEVWNNDQYEVLLRRMHNDTLHLSIKRYDRRALRDWRHLQQIKNEVAGEERTAIEVFPPESELVDSANEYHLFVLPRGTNLGLMSGGRQILAASEANELRVNGIGKGRQRPLQPGLTTGRNE